MRYHEPIGGLGGGASFKWCCARTNGGAEHLALVSAVERGMRCYLPRYVTRIRCSTRHPTRTKEALGLLFPGYLFVGFKGDQWAQLFRAPGILDVLHRESGPQLVDFKLLARLAGKEEQVCGRFKTDRRHWPFKAGDMVRVVDGPFTGFYAKLISLDDGGRIRLLLDILGGATQISGISAAMIEAA
jgi:transcriptional antiterminator RfaH